MGDSMNTEKVDNADSLREMIFEGVTYIDIELPETGTLRVHPYISSRAIDAYVSCPSNPKLAFEVMVAASMELTKDIELVADDAGIIARLYAEKEGFLTRYLELSATSNPFEAFDRSLKESELWQDRAENLRQIEASVSNYIRFHERILSIPRSVEATLQTIHRPLMTLQKVTIPQIKSPDISSMIGCRIHAFETVNKVTQQNALAMNSITAISIDALGRWKDVTSSLSSLPTMPLLSTNIRLT